MDVSDNEKLETAKRGEDSVTYYNTPVMPSDWRYTGPYFVTSSSMALVADGNTIGPSCSSLASIVDSFVPPIWDHLPNSQALGYNGMILQNIAGSSDYLVSARGFPSSLRSGLDSSSWEAPNLMMKGGLFLPNVSTILPHSISHFPADSAFIERAARFSCLSTENMGDMVNPFAIHQSAANPCNRGGTTMLPGPQEVFAGLDMKFISDRQPPKNEMNDVALASQNVPLAMEEGSKLDSQRKNVGFDDETKQDESDEAETAGCGEEEPSLMDSDAGPSSVKGIAFRKRKRGGQDAETEQSQQQPGKAGKDSGCKRSSPPRTTNKNSGKNVKQSSPASDQPKEEYIHVRARRGQATNSHSLAERVRREKISERMKFLQDLVPGCSKVTGKAVMLDEIINYVQSLQRQVEFLSMKLATVNPRLDFNIESLLAKDPMFGAQGGPSTLGFPPDIPMAYPMMHPPQQSLAQPDLAPPLTSSSDALTGIGAEYKESPPQLPDVWHDELHNVVQMGFNPTAPSTGNDEDTNSSLPAAGQMKVEL